MINHIEKLYLLWAKIHENRRHMETCHKRTPGLVSVCIPNYNKGKFIGDCLTAISYQTYEDIEVVIVDDGSDDNSMAVIDKFIEDTKILSTKIYLPFTIGAAWAQNMAYYLAKGEYVCNMDSDDICCPTRIEQQVEHLKAKDLDIVGSDFCFFEKVLPTKPVGMLEQTGSLQSKSSYCFGTLLMKYEVIEKTGGLTKEYIGSEDVSFIQKALSLGFRAANIPELLYFYRNSSTQRSKIFHFN